jgi:hypothetical protein
MARGGVRPGAGRKPGALTKKTRAVAEAIGATGDTPLDTLNELRVWAVGRFREFRDGMDFDKASEAAEFAADIANKQAPFVHPKLSSIEAKVDTQVRATVRKIERVVIDPLAPDA